MLVGGAVGTALAAPVKNIAKWVLASSLRARSHVHSRPQGPSVF